MAYYNEHDLQPVHAADAWNLDRYLFTAVAYLARAGKKEGAAYEDDVLKALWFLAYSVTNDTKHADEVLSTCKNLMLGSNHEDKKGTANKLSMYVRSTNDTGNVSQYCVDGGEAKSELVREKCDNALHGVHDANEEPSFPERIGQWLKGAIE